MITSISPETGVTIGFIIFAIVVFVLLYPSAVRADRELAAASAADRRRAILSDAGRAIRESVRAMRAGHTSRFFTEKMEAEIIVGDAQGALPGVLGCIRQADYLERVCRELPLIISQLREGEYSLAELNLGDLETSLEEIETAAQWLTRNMEGIATT